MKDATRNIVGQFTNPDALCIELKEEIERLEWLAERSGNAAVPYQCLISACARYPLADKVEMPDLADEETEVSEEVNEIFDGPDEIVETTAPDPFKRNKNWKKQLKPQGVPA